MQVEQVREVDQAFRDFSEASYAKHGNYNHVAGVYEHLLAGWVLGFHDAEYVMHRIKSATEELKK